MLFDRRQFGDVFGGDGKRVALETIADGDNALWPGGGEQQRLALRRRMADDRFHIFTKAHLQHTVRLIQHQRAQLSEIQRFALQVIENTPRRADHNMRRMHQRIALSGDWLAAAQRQNFNIARKARQATQFIADLFGQFARRAEHQRLRLILRGIDMLQDA